MMAAGIKKIGDDIFNSEWYREQAAIAKRQNREHVARFDRSFTGVMAKSLAAASRENGDRYGGDDDAGKRVDHHAASTVASLLVEAGSFPHRAAALQHLLHKPADQALLARMHKAADQTEKESQPMTSHTEFVQSVVKQYGIVALAKSMVQDQKSYGLGEHQFTQLATEHAQRVYPNDRPDVAFSKLYQSEESVRRACAVAKAMPFVADVTPLVVGGVDATHEAINNTESSEAYEQLKRLGRDKWPSASEAAQFANAFTDPANATLAAKAHRRPTAPPGGAYPFPRSSLWGSARENAGRQGLAGSFPCRLI